MNEVCDLLCHHRSVRQYTSESITEAQLQSIIKAGNAASTSSNIQARSVIRVTDIGKRKELSSLAGEQKYIITCSEFLVFCADLKRAEACCVMEDVIPITGMTEQFLIASIDVSLMAQNCVIAAESMGLGTCYIGGLRNNPTQVSDLLKIPQQVYPIFGLCLGYEAVSSDIKPRLSPDIILQENEWMPTSKESIQSYNDEMAQYYKSRSSHKKQSQWSEGISASSAKESRPHMREFLKQQGFEMR